MKTEEMVARLNNYYSERQIRNGLYNFGGNLNRVNYLGLEAMTKEDFKKSHSSIIKSLQDTEFQTDKTDAIMVAVYSDKEPDFAFEVGKNWDKHNALINKTNKFVENWEEETE